MVIEDEDERNRNFERKNDHLKSDLTDVKNEITVTMNPINSTVVNRIILHKLIIFRKFKHPK